MYINAVKLIIHKFEVTGCLDIVPGRGPHATAPAIVEEVAIAIAQAFARSSNSTVSSRSIPQALDISWATVRMILHKILNS